jgi:hypothetical protein
MVQTNFLFAIPVVSRLMDAKAAFLLPDGATLGNVTRARPGRQIPSNNSCSN